MALALGYELIPWNIGLSSDYGQPWNITTLKPIISALAPRPIFAVESKKAYVERILQKIDALRIVF